MHGCGRRQCWVSMSKQVTAAKLYRLPATGPDFLDVFKLKAVRNGMPLILSSSLSAIVAGCSQVYWRFRSQLIAIIG